MSAAFTQGQWAIDWNVSRLDIHSGGKLIATLRRSTKDGAPTFDDAEAIANAKLISAAPAMHGALIEAAQVAQDAFTEALRDVPEGSCVPPWITRLQQAAERAHAALVMADERFKATTEQPDPTR